MQLLQRVLAPCARLHSFRQRCRISEDLHMCFHVRTLSQRVRMCHRYARGLAVQCYTHGVATACHSSKNGGHQKHVDDAYRRRVKVSNFDDVRDVASPGNSECRFVFTPNCCRKPCMQCSAGTYDLYGNRSTISRSGSDGVRMQSGRQAVCTNRSWASQTCVQPVTPRTRGLHAPSLDAAFNIVSASWTQVSACRSGSLQAWHW